MVWKSKLMIVVIKGVLYLEAFSTDLVSIKWLTNELNCNAIFSSKNVQFQDRKTGKTIGDGFFENGFYILKNQELIFSATKESIDQELWHKRLGHPSDQTLKKLLIFFFWNCISCDVCKLAKKTILHFSLSIRKSEAPFELFYSDVWGPALIISSNGFKYFVLFIDDFSQTTWLYLLKSKDEVFLEFVNCVENQFNAKIKIFTSDNGTEFVNNNFANLLKEKWIIHQTTCIDTP